MEIYAVGGSVRDVLMGRDPKDLDWVVVGEPPQSMLELGFKQVGADFPVFLDSKGEEYALARTERKTGDGYHGFETNTDDVSLEDDLSRRDLTINSMAVRQEDWEEFRQTKNWGLLIDPFNGFRDLLGKVLRHVGPAFQEDPVRVLRLARFQARYSDFTIATETIALAVRMVAKGELDHLVPERVWAETEKAFSESKYWIYLKTLQTFDALRVVMPKYDDSNHLHPEYEDEFDTENLTVEERFASTCLNMSPDEIRELIKQVKAPSNFWRIADKLVRVETHFNWTRHTTMPDWLGILNEIDAFRDPSIIDSIRRFKVKSFKEGSFDTLLTAYDIANAIKFADLTPIQQKTLSGNQIGQAIEELRRTAINTQLAA